MNHHVFDLTIKNDKKEIIGNLYGWSDNNRDKLEYYLSKHDYALSDLSNSTYEQFAVLESIQVDSAYRGNDYGNELMEDFIFRLKQEDVPDLVILVADSITKNEFDLIRWYENWGFFVVANNHDCPLMILNCL